MSCYVLLMSLLAPYFMAQTQPCTRFYEHKKTTAIFCVFVFSLYSYWSTIQFVFPRKIISRQGLWLESLAMFNQQRGSNFQSVFRRRSETKMSLTTLRETTSIKLRNTFICVK